MIKLFHGTNVEFAELDPSRSREGLDFGTGAYLTADIEQAWGMARRKQMVLGGRKLVMEFDFDDSCLSENASGCLKFDGYNEEWTAFVLKNRNKVWDFKHDYLVVAGPVADGIMPTVIDDYLDIFPKAEDALKKENLSKLTKQLVFKRQDFWQVCFHTIDSVKKYLKFVRLYEQ